MRTRCSITTAAVLALVAVLAPPAHAERLAYYRVGGGAAFPALEESRGSLDAGPAAILGVSVPLAHRFAIALEVAHQRLADAGPEVTAPEVTVEADDTTVNSALLGIELVARRGHTFRPLLSAALGAASVRAGDWHIDDMNLGPSTSSGESSTVFSLALGAGGRWRLPPHHTALRVQAQWVFLAAHPGGYVVPVLLQLEF